MRDDPESQSGNLSAQSKGLGPLLAVNFAGSLGYTIVMPFLVYLVMQWGGDETIRHTSEPDVGSWETLKLFFSGMAPESQI